MSPAGTVTTHPSRLGRFSGYPSYNTTPFELGEPNNRQTPEPIYRNNTALQTEGVLPRSVSRGGVLLPLRRERDPERRCLRRMSTGEWLGSLFHRSRRSKERLRNAGRRPRPLERERRRRLGERECERFRRPAERLLDRLGVLDRLRARPAGERLRLLRAGERDLDRRVLARDLERDFRRRAAERERLARRRWAGLRDLERRFLRSGGDAFFLTGDLDLKRAAAGHYMEQCLE